MAKQRIPEVDALRVDAEPPPAKLAVPLRRFGSELEESGYGPGLVVTPHMVTIHNDLVGNNSYAHDPRNTRGIVPEPLIASLWERLLAVPVPEIDGYDRQHVMPTNVAFRCPVKIGDKIRIRITRAVTSLSARGDHAMVLVFQIMVDKLLKKAEPGSDEPDEKCQALVAEGTVELRFVESFD